MATKPQAVQTTARDLRKITQCEKQIDESLENYLNGECDCDLEDKDAPKGAILTCVEDVALNDFVIQTVKELYLSAGWDEVLYKQIPDDLGWQNDVFILIPPSPKQITQPVVDIKKVAKNPKRGFVYLFYCNGKYKIGRSKNPTERMKRMASAIMPFTIERIHSIGCKDAVFAEKQLHKKYAAKREKGEWFNLNDQDVEEIKQVSVL